MTTLAMPHTNTPLVGTVDVPEGTSGDWKVQRFVVDRVDWHNLLRGRAVPLGATFTRLTHYGHVIMSDTPAECSDHIEPVLHATGSCLINGLGLGVVLKAVLARPNVTDVTVVELSEDVIRLVAPSYEGDPRVQIVHADAITFQPPKGHVYDMVWHDIWPTICEDNLPEMHRLHRKYGHRARWQGSWARGLCEQQRAGGASPFERKLSKAFARLAARQVSHD